MTSPKQQAADVRSAYDTVASDYAAHFPDVGAETQLDRAMLDAFVAAVGSRPDARVLDAGCGAGRISRYLADRGCDVQGIDLSPGMIAMARRDHPDLPFQVGELTDLPFPDDTFAGVLLWYSTIHTAPDALPQIYREVARVLRPGGHVLVGSQSGDGIRDVSAAYREFGHDVALIRYLATADRLSGYLADVGLNEVARLVQAPVESQRDAQAAVLARAG